MNKGLLQKLLPHIIAVVVFLIVAALYCRPALEGKVLSQSDITQWKGSFHQSEVYKETHGHLPLWTNSMFGGMPAFQVGTDSNNFVPGIVHKILTLGLPEPLQFFFLACLTFYFLCIVLRVNPYLGILGGLAFGYATYNPVILVAGHNTKMWAMAYMPAILGGILLVYNKRYWIGGALTALLTATMVAMNHPQITYYFFIAVAILSIFYAIAWIKEKQFKHLAFAFGIALVSVVTGIFVNAVNLMSTYEYQKETIRGDASPLTDTTQKGLPKDGLDKDYAFSYSASITEPLVLMFPRMLGGSAGATMEVKEEKSKAIEALQTIGQQNLNQIAQQSGINLTNFLRFYWGGISQDGKFGGTAGPPYSGAIICFLAILAFFLIDHKLKWGALAALIFFFLLSWGSYFKGFNYFIFDHFPLYNKFRAPSMTLVIAQLILPIMAVLGVQAIIDAADPKTLLPKLKQGLLATGGIFLLLFILYFGYSYLTPGDAEILSSARSQPQLYDIVKSFYDGLIADRKSLLLTDIFRTLFFVALAAGTLWLLIKKTLKPVAAILILCALSFIDLIMIDSNYLNADNYKDASENAATFQKTKADDAILADKSYFRVFNPAGDFTFEAHTSYWYNSLGGYHAVKLRLYQDLLTRQFSRQLNMGVINMLNTKYFIQKDNNGLTSQYQPNPEALGPVWLVPHVEFVKDADAEMAAITHFNPKDTAFVQDMFKASVPFAPTPDSSATIKLIKNDNDIINYEFNAATNQFAVFSEIYYKAGWKAFIDEKEAPIVKTNYVLRGLAVPAGKHKIEFRFEPQGYYTGKKITSAFTIIMLIGLVAAIFFEWRRNKVKQA